MKLEMDPSLAEDYESPSQIARVVTESWADENLYCPACLNGSLDHTKPGREVVDYVCPKCEENYQLKSKKGPIGNRVSNSAYKPKIEAIREGTIPNFAFLRYDSDDWMVRELQVVPSHFMTESVVEKRKPLGEDAERSGWVGSDIILGNLPVDGRIPLVDDEEIVRREKVKDRWDRFSFMRGEPAESRGWLSDVLRCVRRLGEEHFTLKQVYEFEDELAELHPDNKHIRAKIRQQLQFLRDEGVIDFLGDGWYTVRDPEAMEDS